MRLLTGPNRVISVTLLVFTVAAGASVVAAQFAPSRESPQSAREQPVGPLPKRAYLKRACRMPPEWITRIHRGYEPGPAQGRDLIIVPKPPGYVGGLISTTHSGPYDFLQKVPLIFYGPGFVNPQGHVELAREVTLVDLAPTYAELMDFDLPERDGEPLDEILHDTAKRPRLIVTIVIDGGGWNALNRWPDDWPYMQRLVEEGVNIENAIVGSSPSVTPSIHTNIGTGAYPRRHRVTAIVVRRDGGRIVGAFSHDLRSAGPDVSPSRTLRMRTLADLYDLANDNIPEVALVGFGNYITGMLGHGAELDGADYDIAAFEELDQWMTDSEFYMLPDYMTALPGPEEELEDVDVSDGLADGLWRGHEISPLDATPAYAPWQNEGIKAIVENEGFGDDELTDLLYINYKAPDAAGHIWNMIGPEQADVIRSTDAAIGELVSFLNKAVGRNDYLLVITADHGQTPLEAGGWPIYRTELFDDVTRVFDRKSNDRGLIDQTTATTIFIEEEEMKANDVKPEELAAYLSDYTIADNIDKQDYPKEFNTRKKERIFSAVFPGRQLEKIVACSRALHQDGRRTIKS